MKKEITDILMMPVKEGHFNETIGFIREAVSYSQTMKIVLSTAKDYSGKVVLKMRTENGIESACSAIEGSEPLPDTIAVYANEFCAACDAIIMCEQDPRSVTMAVADGKLFIFGFYDESVEEFNFECGLEILPADSVPAMPEFKMDDHLDIGQYEMATVGDSTYGYPYIEIRRISGMLSYRVGDDKFCMANTFGTQGKNEGQDLSIRIPSVMFNAFPKVKIDIKISIDIDTSNKLLMVSGDGFDVTCHYDDGVVDTFSGAGLEKFATIPGSETVMSIGHMRKILPVREIELECLEGNAVATNARTDRVDYSMTIRGCGVEEPGKKLAIPFDVFTKMVIMSAGSDISIMASNDGKKVLMGYSTALYARKCTYSQ